MTKYVFRFRVKIKYTSSLGGLGGRKGKGGSEVKEILELQAYLSSL